MINKLLTTDKYELIGALEGIIDKIKSESVKRIECHIEVYNEIQRKKGVDECMLQSFELKLKIL